MYDLGSDLGLDRSAVEDALGELFAAGLAEIRSLSGQIGLTEAGQTLAAQQAPPSLSSAARSEATPDLVRELRENINRLGLNTRDAADLKADLATITAQQGSSRPQATVINACLRVHRRTAGQGNRPPGQVDARAGEKSAEELRRPKPGMIDRQLCGKGTETFFAALPGNHPPGNRPHYLEVASPEAAIIRRLILNRPEVKGRRPAPARATDGPPERACPFREAQQNLLLRIDEREKTGPFFPSYQN